MHLDYSKLELDENGVPLSPTLVLKTMHGETIGTVAEAYNIKISVKFAEPSEMSFDVPAVIDGERNGIYDELTGHRLIYTAHYGIYVIMNPSIEADGATETKHIECRSIEKTLDTKKFFLEGGDGGSTFKFHNPTDSLDPDTIIGRVLEIASDWHVGYIAPSVAQRYRTFDGYDDYLMSFLYGECAEKFRCVFVFDPYERSINVYDADGAIGTLPIYLDFDNLIEEIEIEEITDELVTAIRPYGSDDVDIREVNPIGTNWIYDLSYFIANGDIPSPLAEKWTAWQHSILTRQAYYKGLVALRASAGSVILTLQAALTDLEGELSTLTAQQSVTIQALAMETTQAGTDTQQAALNEINAKIADKKAEIDARKAEIAAAESDSELYAQQIEAVVNELGIDRYFTAEEYAVLSKYFIEQDITEDSFIATDIDTGVSGETYTLNGAAAFDGCEIAEIDLTDKFGKKMYVLSGGTFSLGGGEGVSGDVIRATAETGADGQLVLSLYAGSIRAGNASAAGGTITVVGAYGGLSSDIREVTGRGVTTREGTSLRLNISGGTMYITADVSEYRKYSVQLELYDYAVSVLEDLATPTYEFSVDSANFIFAKEFAPFRDSLELGKGVYVNTGIGQVITPYIIEFELDFEKRDSFEITFSNRFKRKDFVNTLKDMVETSYTTSRSFEASKYLYNRAAQQSSAVSKFMQSSLDAAVNTVIGAANQSVVIDGGGIHVGGDGEHQLRIVDSMIAVTDDGWETAKLAIGRFATEELGEYYGVNAEVIGGKLIIGNNLVIENETDEGVMQFKVDSSGAWLNNSTLVLQKDNGGKIMIDPQYGIIAGGGSLFTTSGTRVLPCFIDSEGGITFDTDGMPTNSNFFLDIRDGGAYFRGEVNATGGKIGGFALSEDCMTSGSGASFIAINGSGSNANSAYAIWAGATTPSSAKFWVKKDGSIYAKNGTFSGTLSTAKLSGALTAADDDSWLIGCGININDGVFMVDQSGNVTMNGNLTLKNGSITWASLNQSVTSTVLGAYDAAQEAADDAAAAANTAERIANGTFSGGTFINGREIYAPKIYATEFEVVPESVGTSSGGYVLSGYYGSTLYRMLRIGYYAGSAPYVTFGSPCSAYVQWNFPITYFGRSDSTTYFRGNCNFSGASLSGVSGITASFG